MTKIVSVIGQSKCSVEQDTTAYQLGRLLSAAGYAIVCGGTGGVMEAVARGASEAGGMCVGLLPGADSREGNRYLTLAIPTGLGHARNLLVVRAGVALVAIGGGYGTLSEIAFALTIGKTVIGLDTWSASSHQGVPADVIAVGTPEEALQRIEQLV